MVKLRWVFLWLALACLLGVFVLPFVPAVRDFIPQQASDIVMSSAFLGASLLQVLGALGVRAYLQQHNSPARLGVRMSIASAIAWVIAFVGTLMGVAAGAGGLPAFFLIVAPATLIALILQIVSMILLGNAERKARV